MKTFGREDLEANSEKIARLFRECSGLGGEVSPIATEAWPTSYEGAELAATPAMADPGADGLNGDLSSIAGAVTLTAADFVP